MKEVDSVKLSFTGEDSKTTIRCLANQKASEGKYGGFDRLNLRLTTSVGSITSMRTE